MSAANPYRDQLENLQTGWWLASAAEVEMFRSWIRNLRCQAAVLAYALVYRLMLFLRRSNY